CRRTRQGAHQAAARRRPGLRTAAIMETILSSATRELRIGGDNPFCIIGERINPTGRKIFQEQLRRGDLSRIEIDVAQQGEGGAVVLRVNMGGAPGGEAAAL